MKVIYTEKSIESLNETLRFLIQEQKLPSEQASRIASRLLDKADSLADKPFSGQKEDYLLHLKKDHRRLVEGNFKIIYRVENNVIYITDFFDTRQDPFKMKG
ncbi:MAG: type II toxin-antitoxin system RelE/ParE family toxin [Balneolaceae bacterium]|nr:type II toxin-antitoxin system RelE/ParE family toxin [Balneolaceae bacterium]